MSKKRKKEMKKSIKDNVKEELHNVVSGEDKTMPLALIFAIFIIFIYCYFGSSSFFEITFTSVENVSYYKIIYHNCMSFVLFFCLGILYVKFIMKKSLKEFGLGLGNRKLGGYLILIATIVVPLICFSVLLSPDMINTYPLVDLKVNNAWWQWILYLGSYILYYFGWEFLFRGIMLFGTKQRFGLLGAILVTTLISALIHTSIAGFGKPMIETLSAVFAGFIFAFITNKTNSIYYSLYIHALVGICTDLYIFAFI